MSVTLEDQTGLVMGFNVDPMPCLGIPATPTRSLVISWGVGAENPDIYMRFIPSAIATCSSSAQRRSMSRPGHVDRSGPFPLPSARRSIRRPIEIVHE